MKRLLCTTALALTIGAAHADGGYARPTSPSTPGHTNHIGHYYVKAEVGKSWLRHFSGGAQPDYIKGKPKNNMTFGLAVGYKFDNKFRVDLNGQFRKLNFSAHIPPTVDIKQHEKIKNYSIFINGYYDIQTGSMFTPYLTAGVGYAHNKAGVLSSADGSVPGFNFTAPSKGKHNFAWNAGTGLIVKLNHNLDLDVSYRYLDLGKAKAGATTTASNDPVNLSPQAVRAQQAMIALIYKF